MHSEYVEKLKAFSKLVDGEFSFTNQPTTTLKRVAWSRVEIRIPHSNTDLFYIAFSGTNSAEVHSGFYAKGGQHSGISCRITQKDGLLNLFSMFSKGTMKSGRSSLDNKLGIACNNKSFLLKLTGNHEAARFLEKHIRLPLEFAIGTNDKGILKQAGPSASLISLSSNEWMVEQKQLMELLEGFKNIVSVIS